MYIYGVQTKNGWYYELKVLQRRRRVILNKFSPLLFVFLYLTSVSPREPVEDNFIKTF